jgi:hypothetical protein
VFDDIYILTYSLIKTIIFKKKKSIRLRAEHQEPQINKFPQLLGINMNNDQNLATVLLLGGRLAFRQERLRSVCYVRS